LGFSRLVDPNVMMLLALCDGQHSLGEVVTQMAAKLHAEPEQVLQNAAGVVRSIIRAGFPVETARRRQLSPN
jgi:hypothetical protein